jgi:oligopeptide transport system substrate-binding protein
MVDSDESDYAAYRNNERDWTLVPDADVDAVRADPQLSKEAREYTELTTFWLQMNNARKPLDNPLVRRALGRALDRQALIRDIAGGVGQPALSVIPPGMPGFQPDLGKDLEFDPNAAKQLLAQAGFSDPSSFPHLRFRFGSSSANQTRAEFIQAQLKQNLGIQIDLDAMEPKAYQAAVKDRDYDLGYGGWGADYPDPQDWLSGLFTCKATNNAYNYCDPQFDQAAARGDTLTDQRARLQAYAQAQQTLEQDVPVIPLFFRGRMVLVKPWVQNLVITAKDEYPGVTFLNQVSVARH